MTTAIGYTRLSQKSDTSIDRQKRRIRDYCSNHELDLKKIFDEGERASGFDTDRAEYQKVRDRIEEGDVDAIVVNDRQRIGRDADERLLFVISLRQQDIELHTSMEGEINLSNPTNLALESFHAAKDDEGKREEIKKSKQAVEERQENGCYHGTPPKGLEFAEDKCHLQKSKEWDDLEHAFELFEKDDNTLGEISDDTGFTVSTLSRMRSRGRSYYEGRLEEYGMS